MTTKPEIRISPDTERTRRAYDRSALWYDIQEWLPEKLAFRSWRKRLWSLVPGGEVLEVGVGTGRNFQYHEERMHVTAIDLSPKMLRRAEARAKRDGIPVSLLTMDAQALDFPDSQFDAAVATFVFCSVPDPVLGLSEVWRVLKPGGRIYLLEHVLSHKPVLGWLMRHTNGFWRALSGANIARETVANVEAAGFDIVSVEDLRLDVVKLIVAEKTALT
jgi:ubiquinone/menaquinone biosynthesis C-methylase UbiE